MPDNKKTANTAPTTGESSSTPTGGRNNPRSRGRGKRGGNREPRKRLAREEDAVEWKPRTQLGKEVMAGNIESLDAIWTRGKVLREPEIVDHFLPGLEERVLKIGKGKRPFRWVQRMTDSGRRNKYFVMVAVGDKNGYVGVSIGHAKDYATAITQGVRKAKLSIINVKRGCGSWDCSCKDDHSVRNEVTGKTGSVKITLKPAPKGTGLAVNYISRDIIELAGIRDAWSSTAGHTKTRMNVAIATFEALKELGKQRRGYHG